MEKRKEFLPTLELMERDHLGTWVSIQRDLREMNGEAPWK
jgi:hypothetical protein